jgi:hypothetical protein
LQHFKIWRYHETTVIRILCPAKRLMLGSGSAGSSSKTVQDQFDILYPTNRQWAGKQSSTG